jgi:hypothetical protein
MPRHKPVRQINLRVGEALRRKLEAAAKARGISTNTLMRQVLENAFGTENEPQLLETRVHNVEEGRYPRFERLESRLRDVEDKTVVLGRRLEVLEENLEARQRDQEDGGRK